MAPLRSLVVPGTAIALADQPQMTNHGGGSLKDSRFFIVANGDLIKDGTVWRVYNMLTTICNGPWLQGAKQYGVNSSVFAGYAVNTSQPGTAPSFPTGTVGILICNEAEAHAFDKDGFVYGKNWAGFHSVDDRGQPYEVCPIPDGPMGDFTPTEVLDGTASHEHMETLTDPIPGTGWTFSDGGEAVDTVCLWKLVPVTSASSGYTYMVNRYWRNDVDDCWDPDQPPSEPLPEPTLPPMPTAA